MSIDDGRFVVTFDQPVDGSLLDDDWLQDTTSGTTSGTFFSQLSPTQAEFAPNAGSIATGDAWEIAIEQAELQFPQSGVVV